MLFPELPQSPITSPAATASPGLLNVYLYHPEQRSDYGDHFFPSGLVMPNTSVPYDFGPGFAARPELVPELDRWYCYEYMVRANTPNQRDGRITVWLDGELVADFPNLRLRDVEGIHARDADAVVVHVKHDLHRLDLAAVEDDLEDPDDELAGRVVVVVQQDSVQLGTLELLLGARPGDDGGIAFAVGCGHFFAKG